MHALLLILILGVAKLLAERIVRLLRGGAMVMRNSSTAKCTIMIIDLVVAGLAGSTEVLRGRLRRGRLWRTICGNTLLPHVRIFRGLLGNGELALRRGYVCNDAVLTRCRWQRCSWCGRRLLRWLRTRFGVFTIVVDIKSVGAFGSVQAKTSKLYCSTVDCMIAGHYHCFTLIHHFALETRTSTGGTSSTPSTCRVTSYWWSRNWWLLFGAK